MLLYHKMVDVDGDGTFYTIVESCDNPARIIDVKTQEEIRYYSVRYAEGPYDIVRDSGGELVSMGLRDNNQFVGEPEIEIALRSATGLPFVFPVVSYTDMLIAHIKTPGGMRIATIHLRPWEGKTWLGDYITKPQAVHAIALDATTK